MNEVYLGPKNTTDIKVNLPPINFFVNQIKNNKPFVFVKVNHGWWDAIYRIKKNNVHKKNLEVYANLLFKSRKKRPWCAKTDKDIWFTLVSKWVDILINYDKQPSNLYVGVCHTSGIFFNTKLINLNMIKIWQQHNKRLFYHGGLLRHYILMDEMQPLIRAMNNANKKVHVIGPSYCKEYKKFLSNFNFIEIPFYNGANQINSIYDNLKKNAKGGDIVLASFGDAESLLIDFCMENNLTLMGIGRAFDYLVKNKIPPMPGHPRQMWFKPSRKFLKRKIKNIRTNKK